MSRKMKIEADTSCNLGRGRILIFKRSRSSQFYSEMLIILDLRKSAVHQEIRELLDIAISGSYLLRKPLKKHKSERNTFEGGFGFFMQPAM